MDNYYIFYTNDGDNVYERTTGDKGNEQKNVY